MLQGPVKLYFFLKFDPQILSTALGQFLGPFTKKLCNFQSKLYMLSPILKDLYFFVSQS